MFKVNEYEIDLLVIGGAGAGLRAAWEASKKKVKVLVVSKGKAARSGCTVLCTAGYAAAFQELGDHPDAHFADSLKIGENLNDRKLLKLLAYNSPKRLMELYEIGARLLEKDGQPVPYGKGPGHSAPRNFRALPHTHLGIEITSCLLQAAQAAGVKFIDRVYVADLLLCAGEVSGCIGLSLDTAELIVIKAKSTVLATGGGCAIYSRTNNPKDMVGDGHSMAWRAGAEMVNMEFVLFHPTVPVRPAAGPLMIPTFTFMLRDGAILKNHIGEDIIKKYTGSSFATITRDEASRYMVYEMKAGRGVDQGIYLDATDLDPALLEEKYSHLLEAFLKKGLDIRKEPFVVGPGSHSFLGGARINQYCETSIPGLFAAGEATGGIHGSHELPGNHLADTQVFGAIAGEHAAIRAGSMEKAKWNKALVEEHIKKIERMEGTSPYNLTKTIPELKEVMWDEVGVIRTEGSLKKARDRVHHYKEMLASIKAEGKGDFIKLLNLRSILDVASLITFSALERKESRGSHYREDFPRRDDSSFLGNIILKRKDNGTVEKEFRPLKGVT